MYLFQWFIKEELIDLGHNIFYKHFFIDHGHGLQFIKSQCLVSTTIRMLSKI